MPASLVLVPEAAVDLDGLAPARKDDVWRTGEVATVEAEAVAHRM